MPVTEDMLLIDSKTAATVLDCAQYFEYNVDHEEFMDLWMKCDPHEDRQLGEHMWGKFSQRTTGQIIQADLLHTIGHSDLRVSKILAKMVIFRCQEKDPGVINRYDEEKSPLLK